ncbi:lysylphosphatidylglycerol synthase transmembrane domain-containing protein [Mesobacillus subterraneus]|uniref:Phosphatidylglycerol lysyltransferase n=1 Tax=Mesobacillus subterraneus TaxID=285983 RepID=A0A427TT70_9BACI|nr:lysylphosphatidylglycerol synthase transmembrane domain-containing protein [Mesobacillus subterraneus]RSD27650.1 UPF0104 family protein [Mesobacillus subterraneus]
MKNSFKKIISILLITAFFVMTAYYLDVGSMMDEIRSLASNSVALFLILISYFSAFLARGIAWQIYLKGKATLKTCMYGLFYSLLLNHLLPVKAGDFARVGILKAREPHITVHEAFNSVVVLRLLDTAILFGMAMAGLAFLELPVNGMLFVWLMAAGAGLSVVVYFKFRVFFNKHIIIMKSAISGWKGMAILALTLASWIMEAAVIYGVVMNGGSSFGFIQAIWVNSITVAGQIFQITPGGIASYEAVMVFALGAAGIAGEKAYTAAVITHGLKYVFSFIVGGIALAAYPVPIHLLKKWTKERGNES